MVILWNERHVRFWGYLDLYWNNYIYRLMWSVNKKFAPNVDALWLSHVRIKKPTCFSSCSFSNFCIKSCAPSNEANQKCHKWLWWLVNIAGKSSVQHSMEQTLPCYRYVLELVSSLAEIMSFHSSQSNSKKKQLANMTCQTLNLPLIACFLCKKWWFNVVLSLHGPGL